MVSARILLGPLEASLAFASFHETFRLGFTERYALRRQNRLDVTFLRCRKP